MWIGLISEYDSGKRFQFYLFTWLSCGTRDLRYCNVGSFVVAHTLSSCGVPALEHRGSGGGAHGLRWSAAHGILVPWPQIKHASPALQSWFFAMDHQGRSPLSSSTPLPLWILLLPSSMMGSSQTPPTPFSFLIFILSPWGFIHPVAKARAPRTPTSPCLA